MGGDYGGSGKSSLTLACYHMMAVLQQIDELLFYEALEGIVGPREIPHHNQLRKAVIVC